MTADVKQAVEKTYSFAGRDSRNETRARTQAATVNPRRSWPLDSRSVSLNSRGEAASRSARTIRLTPTRRRQDSPVTWVLP
jgi:uncharacterized protein RhaS with RHS repeats